jgi:hypothetical protein
VSCDNVVRLPSLLMILSGFGLRPMGRASSHSVMLRPSFRRRDSNLSCLVIARCYVAADRKHCRERYLLHALRGQPQILAEDAVVLVFASKTTRVSGHTAIRAAAIAMHNKTNAMISNHGHRFVSTHEISTKRSMTVATIRTRNDLSLEFAVSR